MGINIKLDNLIYPYFVIEGRDKKEAIESFPGVFRFSSDRLIKDVAGLRNLGIKKVLLFGIPEKKDVKGSLAYAEDNIIISTVKKIKSRFPDIAVFTDVCLCAYTDHGHCGVLKSHQGAIDNKETLRLLARIAVAHAAAGADWVAPSAMAKGQVLVIRGALNKQGFKKIKILAYSAKFASNFYGPFRNAASSAPKFGDRSAYQLNYTEVKSAFKRIKDDIKDGADAVMVKPALSYLDIIIQVKQRFDKPIFAYSVSGEYSFVKYGARQGLWDERKMVDEIIASIRRAGADFIITYHAKDIARWQR